MSVLKAFLLLATPIALLLGGAAIMARLSGREAPAGLKCRGADSETPLNQRLCGYGAEAVAAHWKTFSAPRMEAEKRFLKLDLAFPFLYGGALLASLLLARAWIGRPFGAHWLVILVGIVVIADWIENSVQLGQLDRWSQAGTKASVSALQAGWIQVASFATIVKLWGFLGAFTGLFALAILVAIRWHPTS